MYVRESAIALFHFDLTVFFFKNISVYFLCKEPREIYVN